MDSSHYSTEPKERKRGQHLGAEERGAIQQLKRLGFSNRSIARAINCSPSTVGYELRRGTPKYLGRGRRPGYSAKRGAAVYRQNRTHCHRSKQHLANSSFLRWMAEKVLEHKWSLDVCVGRAKLLKRFEGHIIPSTKTLYNLLWRGELPVTPFHMPEALRRKQHGKARISKRMNGKSIDLRPAEVAQRIQFGHWESDTVLGRKGKDEPAVFTIVERLTGFYLTIYIAQKTAQGVADAMRQLHDMFGTYFSEVFRTITTDNGSEFSAFSEAEVYGTQVYFAHPYSSWERPVNERSNRMLRRFMPKGKSMFGYTDEQVLMFSDEMNSTPRKRLGYRTPEELFEGHLDEIYRC